MLYVQMQTCKKGSKIYVEGALQTRKWTDNAGIEKYSTEVVLQKFNGELTMLDSRNEDGGYGGGYGGYGGACTFSRGTCSITLCARLTHPSPHGYLIR